MSHWNPSRPDDRGVSDVPDMMPVLSRGKHRNPKKGACFMELASFLAGEPWSDHPACTHPLLASWLATSTTTSATTRAASSPPHIPEVIGLNGDRPPGRRLDRS